MLDTSCGGSSSADLKGQHRRSKLYDPRPWKLKSKITQDGRSVQPDTTVHV